MKHVKLNKTFKSLTDPPPLKGPVGGSGSESFWTNFMLGLIYVQSKVHSQMDFDFRPQILVLWTRKKIWIFFFKNFLNFFFEFLNLKMSTVTIFLNIIWWFLDMLILRYMKKYFWSKFLKIGQIKNVFQYGRAEDIW